MVQFVETCIFRGPSGGRVHLSGEVFISYYRRVTEVWPFDIVIVVSSCAVRRVSVT